MRFSATMNADSLRTALFAAVLTLVPQTRAGEASVLRKQADRPTFLGASECEFDVGMFSSFAPWPAPDRPAINYELQTLRLGWMAGDVGGSGFWRGTGEFLVGVFGGPVTQGPGSGLAGGELILRYNFSPRDSRFIPFAEIGAGGLYNDIHTARSQVEIGMGFEFMLHAGIGTHVMFGEHWALNLEADFRHISNASIATRNGGLNSFGGTLGFSYFFR